ncbi:MAG: DUF6268 family outer membrane beta-barrel protein [Candidatus Zixiibacteriota bacterium]
MESRLAGTASLLTDLENVGSNHVTIRAGFIFTKKVSRKFTYGIGAGYSDDFGQPIVLPVARLKWRPSHRWKINFDVPQKLDVWYLMSNRLSFGIEGKVTGAQFRIGESVDIGDGRLTGNGRVKYSIFNLGPAVKIGLYEGLSLTVNGGRTLYRRFEVLDVDDNQLQDYQFETSYSLKARIGFSVGSD